VAAYSRAEYDCQLPDGRKYYRFDLGMAVMNLMLAATEHGLAARPMAGFDPVEIRKAFGLADADDLMVVVAVGRPDDGESHLPERYKGLGRKPRERKDGMRNYKGTGHKLRSTRFRFRFLQAEGVGRTVELKIHRENNKGTGHKL